MVSVGRITFQVSNLQNLADWDNFKAAVKTMLQGFPNAKLVAGTDAQGNATVTITYDSSVVGQSISITISHQFAQTSQVI